MAELHRRVLGLPDRVGVAARAVGLAVAWLVLPASGIAQTTAGQTEASTAEELGRLAALLGAEDEGDRQRAVEGLSTLGPEDLPAVDARLEAMGRVPRLDSDEASRAVARIRHQTGSRRADDLVDVLPGILPRLRQTRDEATRRMAERLCLLRALESIGTVEAGRRLADLLGLHYAPLKWEARRIVQRLGVRLLPVLIEARSHRSRGTRRWVRWGEEHLGLGAPGRAVLAARSESPDLLAALLRAYARVKDMDAMPVIATFVADDKRIVREASRWAMAQYGRNGIWQLRRAYRVHVGEDADLGWDWRRTADRLYAAVDEARTAPARAELESGLEALRAGNLDEMRQRFESVLEQAPRLARREEMAPGWAMLAAERRSRGALDESMSAYRRALALAPRAPQAVQWKAELAFLEAVSARARGVVDLSAYARVLELDPAHDKARDALDRLSGQAAERDRQRRRAAALGGALLLLLTAWLLVRRRGRRVETEPGSDAEEGRRPTAEPRGADVGGFDTDALDTLPG